MTSEFHPGGWAPGRRSFAEEVESLTAIHAGGLDALMHPQAVRVAREVILHAIIKTNTQLAAGLDLPELSEILPDGIDVYSDIGDVTERLQRVAELPDLGNPDHPWLARSVATLVQRRFARGRCEAFLDTDEIPGLVAVAYGVGLFVRRELPGLATKWVIGEERSR